MGCNWCRKGLSGDRRRLTAEESVGGGGGGGANLTPVLTAPVSAVPARAAAAPLEAVLT